MEVLKFNPTKAELELVASEAKKIAIKDIDDKEGYELMKKTRFNLGKYRTKISNFGKLQRKEARDYAKEVIRQERELLEIIVPIEDGMKDKIKEVDDTILYNKRLVMLPARRKMIDSINGKLTDEEILVLDESQFSQVYKDLEECFEADKKRKLEEEAIEKQRAIDEEKRKEEAVKQAVKDERERADRDKKAEEDRKENEAKDKKINEEKEAEHIAKNKEYNDWLEKHNVNLGDGSAIVNQFGNRFVLYKKVDEITIK